MKHERDTASALVVEVDIKNAYSGSDYASLEECLCELRGVTGMHLDRTRGVAYLSYDPAVTTPERLEGQLRRRDYNCDCKSRAESKSQPGHPCVGEEDDASMSGSSRGDELRRPL